MSDAPLLSLRNVSISFGGVRAVHGVSLELRKGELVGLIGPNGAGKSTVLNLISGSVRPTEGDILFKGKSIVGLRPDVLSRIGISRTFQNIRLFPQMTAFENVALGIHGKPLYSFAESFVRTRRAWRAEAEVRERALSLLELVDLTRYAKERAGSLPYGLQRRLELARAMATGPELLLLDEPAAGMNEDECGSLVELIRRIHEESSYGMILIEHHMNVVMELCADSLIYVLNLGEILASGSPREVQADQRVIGAYLGAKRSANERRRRRIS
jgi:branched-chain amino acid transport system ATP-binding protein